MKRTSTRKALQTSMLEAELTRVTKRSVLNERYSSVPRSSMRSSITALVSPHGHRTQSTFASQQLDLDTLMKAHREKVPVYLEEVVVPDVGLARHEVLRV